MTPTPYLFFNGQCADALAAYQEILGAEILERLPASELPGDYAVPEARKEWIMHARLRIGAGQMMASDNIMADSAPMEGCSVMLSYPTAAEAEGVFERLSEGGAVRMAFAPTFWSAGFGALTDRFGVKWMIGTDEPPAS